MPETDEEIINSTCLSISDISQKTINELRQEIDKIKKDKLINPIAKYILIKQAENGIETFIKINKKVNDFCFMNKLR